MHSPHPAQGEPEAGRDGRGLASFGIFPIDYSIWNTVGTSASCNNVIINAMKHSLDKQAITGGIVQHPMRPTTFRDCSFLGLLQYSKYCIFLSGMFDIKRKIKGAVRRMVCACNAPVVQHVHTTAQVATLAPNELLAGRAALVTGGTSGIGFAIAEAFLNSGARVVICGRNEQRNADAVATLKKRTGENRPVASITLDTMKCDEFEDAVRRAVDVLGQPIDILVNNAGRLGGNIRSSSPAEFDEVLSTNLRGSFFLSRVVAKQMVQNQVRGNILNITSSSSLRPANSAYTLSKWGMRALTLGLAKSLIPHGIVVNAIAPGPTADAPCHNR